jgi:hypothetical protein
MAAPIESPAKCEVRAGIRELHHIIPVVSKTTIHEAVTEKSGHRKLCARWVPKMLMDVHKTKRMGSALKFLMRYAQEGDEFLESIATGDETWLFRNTPETKQQLDNDDEMQEEVVTLLKGQAPDLYDSGVQKLVPRLNKSLDNAGDYVEK